VAVALMENGTLDYWQVVMVLHGQDIAAARRCWLEMNVSTWPGFPISRTVALTFAVKVARRDDTQASTHRRTRVARDLDYPVFGSDRGSDRTGRTARDVNFPLLGR
jgi:hypothetical protein